MNTFVMNEGDLSVNFLDIGGVSSDMGVFTQAGGTAACGSLSLGHTAVLNLDGGLLTMSHSWGLSFDSGANSYMDFDGGALRLPGNWDFDRLVGLAHSDFRAFGEPATEGDLRFDLIVLGTDVYTQVSAVPEPTTLALLATAALGFLGIAWRRRQAQ